MTTMMTRPVHEFAAAFVLLLIGAAAYAFLGGGPNAEDSPPFLIAFGLLTLLAFPIGYAMPRFFLIAGTAPAAGMVIAMFIDIGGGNLWPIAIAFWTAALLPAFGLSWAGHLLRRYRHHPEATMMMNTESMVRR